MEKKGYEYLEHTGDLKFRARGETLEEAFSWAAQAMMGSMIDTGSVKPAIEKKIMIEAENMEALLYLWLEEFLINLDAEFFIPNKIPALEIRETGGKYQLKAAVRGDVNNGQYELSGAVKAATYNEMEIKKKNDYWELQAVVDI